jgi:hypothetical protein
MIAYTLFVLFSAIVIAMVGLSNRHPREQATRLPKRLDERKPVSAPKVMLNRKQRRTIASLQRRGKLHKVRLR